MTEPRAATNKPIAILFANMKGNVGDFAILHAMLKTLATAHPRQSVHVYAHPLAAVDTVRMQAFRTLAPAYDYRGVSPGRRLGSPTMMALKLGFLPGGLGTVIARLARSQADDFKPFTNYDAVYVAGGEQWNGRRLGAVMFSTLKALTDFGVPVRCYPFSVKPKIAKFYSPKNIARLFAMLRPVMVVRDASTAEFLGKSGLKATVGTDSVFALQDEVDAIAPAAGRNGERILLAATGTYAVLSAAASALMASGHTVEALTTCEPEDRENLERLKREFGIVYHAPVTWQDFAAELKVCKLVVTNRLHGLIFSTLALAPLFPVTNREKVRAFVTDAGIRHHATSLTDLDAKIISDAIDGRAETKAQMVAYALRSRNLRQTPLP